MTALTASRQPVWQDGRRTHEEKSPRPIDRRARRKDHFAYASQRAYEANSHFSTLQRGNDPPPPDDRQRGEMALANAGLLHRRGLKDLSAGLRATYIPLDQVNRKLPK